MAAGFFSAVNPVDRAHPLAYVGAMTSPIAPRQTRPGRSTGTIVLGVVLVVLGVASAVALIWAPAFRNTSGSTDGVWQGGMTWLCALSFGLGALLLIIGLTKRARWRRTRHEQ